MSSIGFIARFSSFDLLNKPDSADNRYSIFQPLLETLVHDNHRLYEMENQDKTNVLYRTLAALYELGATQEQSIKAYYNILPDLVPLRSTISMEITKDNWREHLGNSSFYAAYLAFFAHQIHEKGMDEAVHEYLLGGRLYASIGSHLQPLVHLTFGLEHDLALVVAQGLAYLASTYSDISDMLSIDSSFPQCSETKEEKVIFELIASDPRFSGRMGDRLTSSQASKRLLKTHKQLLTAYMNSSDISLGRLARIAAGLLVATSGDKSLAAVQLLESALAMQTICSRYGEQPELLQVQYLFTLCTFILLDCPCPNHDGNMSSTARSDWEPCTGAILEQGDINSILALKALLKAHSLYDKEPIYCIVAKRLAESDGRWRRL